MTFNLDQEEFNGLSTSDRWRHYRDATGEITRLKHREDHLWLGLTLIKNAGTDDPKKLKQMAAAFVEED